MTGMFQKWKTRSSYELSYKENITDLPFGWILAGCFCTLVLVLIRSWPHFIQPTFYVEDSIFYFNYFYGDNCSLHDIFQKPRGYYNLFSSLAGWFIAKADVVLQPLLYHVVALCMGGLTCCAFSFSGLIRNKILLFITPLLLGLSGMNHVFYYITLHLQGYVVVVFLLSLLFYRTKPGAGLGVAFFALLAFCVWSGPYSVLVVPFSLLYILLYRDSNYLFILLIVVTLAYVTTADSGMVRFAHLVNPFILKLWIKALVVNVFLMGMVESLSVFAVLSVVAFFTVVYFTLYKDRFFIKTSLLFLAIIVLSFAPFLLSAKIVIYRTFMPAHFYIAQFFWLAFILFTVERMVVRLPDHAKRIIICFSITTLCFIVVDNVRNPEKYRYELYPATSAFVKKIKELEQQNLQEKKQQIIVEMPGTLVMIRAKVGDQSKDAQVVKRILIQ